MFKINLSYFPSRARLNFQWIFKEFDLRSNMKGFFENFLIGKETEESVDDSSLDQWPLLTISNFYFLALLVKKLKKVLMIFFISQ